MTPVFPKDRVVAFSLATLAWSSVVLQCRLSVQLALHNGKSIGAGLEIFSSYFTVLTNLLICVSLTASLIGTSSARGQWFSRPAVAAGIATSIAFVGLAYHFLLRNTWNPQGAQRLADLSLHYVVPTFYLLYWWFTCADAGLRWIYPLFWSVYPTAYLVYALVRGSITGSYPYPFIDAAKLGYKQTMLTSLVLLLAFIALGVVFVALGRARQRTVAS